MSRPFEIAGHRIGNGEQPYVIAEVGVNHNGNPSLARKLIDAAAEARADAVKFQTFRATSLATAGAAQAAYQLARGRAASQLEMLSALELPAAAWAELADHARERNITFLSTPFDAASAELLVGLGVPALKVGSGDLTNALLLRAVAGHGLPVILSTGMSTLNEVDDAVRALRQGGARSLALMHCASVYPAVAADLNLRAMDTLVERFGVPVGFSDHTDGMTAPIAAAARGAAIIEKHITLDRGMPGPDHAASLEVGRLAAMVTLVHEAWISIGDGVNAPRGTEADVMRVARRSLVTARKLPPNHVLVAADLDARRPGSGISPMRIDEVLGRRLRASVTADHVLQPGDLDPPLPPPAGPAG
jgi:N,N'-diacetyllegionaminate synthase